MSDVLYKQALAVTALIYREMAAGDAADPDFAVLKKKALDLPASVRKLAQAPSQGEVVRLRSDLADFRHWLEEQDERGMAVPIAEFDALAGILSRGLSWLKARPAP